MRTITKALAGIAAAATISVTAAAPAEARHRYYHRDRGGVDVGDVVAGAAIIGGIAAIAHGINQRSRYNGNTYGQAYPAYPQSGYGYQSYPQGGYSPAYPQGGYAPAYPQGGYAPAYPQGGYAPAYPQGGYAPAYPQGSSYGYGYGSERQAVDLCTAQAQRTGARVRDIDEVDRDGPGYRVRGDLYVQEYEPSRYGGSYDVDSENFTCTVSGDRILDFRVDGRRW